MLIATGDASTMEPDDGGEVLFSGGIVEIEFAAFLLVFGQLGSFGLVGEIVEGEVILSGGELDKEGEE